MTNINTEWENIIKQAEESLMDTLIRNYGEVLTTLEEEREMLQISMQRATQTSDTRLPVMESCYNCPLSNQSRCHVALAAWFLLV